MADQLSPTSARRASLTTPSASVAALDNGAPGPTVLLLPGYTGSKEDFAPILDPLADRHIHAISIDLPGQFESPGPDLEADFRPEALGPIVAELISALPEPVVLLGHSYGGLVARAAVLAGAPVAGLILLCSGPASFTSGARLEALKVGEPILRENGRAAAYAIRAATTEDLRAAPRAELAAFLERRFLASSTAGLLGMASALVDSADLTSQLATALAGRPAAVIAGEADDAWPLDVQATMAARLGTTLRVITDAAHSPAVENPAALVELLASLVEAWT